MDDRMNEQKRRPAMLRVLLPFTGAQYRRLAGALSLSLIGSGIWVVALVWQVIALGGGPVDLSLVAAANAAGMLLTVLLAGAVADRVPQKRILVAVEFVKIASVGTAATLSLLGVLEVWHLVLVGLAFGIAEGFFYPAYSAWLPSLLPAEQLLAANGIEGVLRPAALNALGPALAGSLLVIVEPGWALVAVVASQVIGVVLLARMTSTPLRATPREGSPVKATLLDIGEGFAYMVRTPWLLATLLFACLSVLAVIGPLEVLLPFAVRDQTGGEAGSFAIVLACYGIGGAVGSIVVASRRMPRRYLTVMILFWGLGGVPFVLIGVADTVWLMAAAVFVVGFSFQAATVIWGTLLQRRVPPALLGRVSSLDFFVSLALMPVSMALAGPVGEAVGIPTVFIFAGLIPVPLAVLAILLFRLRRDEIAHPLDSVPPHDSDAPVASPGSGEQNPA